MTLQERMKELRLSRGYTLLDIANHLGVKEATVQRYESGQIKNIKHEIILKLANLYGCSPSYLIGWENASDLPHYPNVLPIKGKHMVPVIGSAACGKPIYKPGDGTEFAEAGPDVACDFALIAEGDSMIGDRIQHGDVVFIRKQPDADDGSIVAVAIDDEVMLKHIYHSQDAHGNISTQFVSSNPRYAPITIGGEDETRRVSVLGKAVAFRSLL